MFTRSRIAPAIVMALTVAACGPATTTSPTSASDATNGAVHNAQAHSQDSAHHSNAGHSTATSLADAATHVAARTGDWSTPATWENETIPTAGSRVHIPTGVTVTVDGQLAAEIKTIGVDGTLRFATDIPTELRVDTLVTTMGARLEVGTPTNPVAPDVTARIVFADDGPIDRTWDPTLVSRGAILHGTTVMHGAAKTSFVAVSRFPAKGDTQVSLSEAPVGWRPGDAIVVAGTDPSDPTSDELRTISSITGNVVQLNAALELDHIAPRPDLEVHVANLTRNVQFTSQNPEIAHRGHVMFMHTNDVSIDYVSFDDLGRSDKAQGYDDVEFIDLSPFIPAQVLGGDNVRGRYSVHFHRGGTDRNTTPARANGSVVSGGPGWGFVNHSSYVEFTNNAAYDIVGAAYYTEAGDEIGSFIDNIALRIVNPNMPLKGGEEIDPDARENLQDYGFQGDGMWLHSPNVRVEGNVFSGISGHAVIVWPEGLLELREDGSTVKVYHDTANVPAGELIGPAGTRMQIMDVPIGSFRGNQAYSATRGIQVFYLHTEFFGDGLHVAECTIDPPAEYDAQLRSTFADSTIWNVDEVGFAAPYTNRITIDGLRIIGDGTADTIGIDVGHFRNDLGIDIQNVTVEGFGTGVRINAIADISFSEANLTNQTDVEYLIPDEDGEGTVVSGPQSPQVEEPDRDNLHLASCVPGASSTGLDPDEESGDDGTAQGAEEEESDGLEMDGITAEVVDLLYTAVEEPELLNDQELVAVATEILREFSNNCPNLDGLGDGDFPAIDLTEIDLEQLGAVEQMDSPQQGVQALCRILARAFGT